MDNPWATLQSDVKARLESSSCFDGIPIVTEDMGDITAAVESALAKGALGTESYHGAGLAILLVTPRAVGGDSNSAHLICDTTLRLAVFEQGAVNRGAAGLQKPALDVVWQAVKLLQGWKRFQGAVAARLVTFDSDEDSDAGVLSYYADFLFRQSLQLD
jgi:hypothetical protein